MTLEKATTSAASGWMACDVKADADPTDADPTYWYEGRCPQTGILLRLPRTRFAERVARELMQELAQEEQYNREAKMYGILLVETPTGEQQILKAFSGLLNGKNQVEGWVSPITGHSQVALVEAQALTLLEAIKQELITLKNIPEQQQYALLAQEFETRLSQLKQAHQQRKQERQQQRQMLMQTLTGDALSAALEALDTQSRQAGIERRRLKQQRDAALEPLQQAIAQAETRIRCLKQRRKALSRHLQAQMHAAYRLTNFAGESLPLQAFQAGKPAGLPTGTGDCCAPKLLHCAATHGLKPIAMAEFWWGAATADKIQGQFYPACAERCQPLMGFLLSGLPSRSWLQPAAMDGAALVTLYEDVWLIAVNKPAGLLSVPGRYADRQDSVLSRLQMRASTESMKAVHRLDQDTSGILLLARDAQTYRQLSQQFQQGQVHKIYEAVLAGVVAADAGVIDLPLWGDPTQRPCQQVDWLRGKPSQTQFRVMERSAARSRIEFVPLTGRTHQLRVHAAAANGLGAPILGDRLYGGSFSNHSQAHRLHLHARALQFQHPHTGEWIHLHSETPF